MATLNLSAYKPSSGQSVSASPISNAFTAIEAATNSIDNTQFAAGRIFDPTKLIEASSVQRIADSTAGGVVANIDFTSISANFAHLLVVVQGREDSAVVSDFLLCRLNNDSAANYDSQRIQGTGATATSAEALAQTSVWSGFITGASAVAGKAGSSAFFIPGYAQTTFHKQVVALTAGGSNTTTGTLWAMTLGGVWRSTAAINRITLLPGAGNFIAGTRATIYGLG